MTADADSGPIGRGTPRPTLPRAALASASIPQELRDLPQWVAWRRKPPTKTGGKFGKEPVAPATGRNASTTDPKTWGTFDAAVSCARQHGLAGVGFVFSATSGYVGIDLDGCIDPTTGEISEQALEIVRACPGYVERSPSGKGIHVIVRGSLPAGGNRKGSIEMYATGRFFTMTGSVLDEFSGPIVDRTPELAQVHAKVFGCASLDFVPPLLVADVRQTATLSDDDIVDRARRASNAAKFEALWRGDDQGYPSASEGDLALCSILAFWTHANAEQIDRLIRKSGRLRPKWDEKHGAQTYGQRTIATAVAGCASVYSGKSSPIASSASVQSPPILRSLAPYQPFPTHLLPTALSGYVAESAVAMGCDEALVALPLLAAVATAIGNTARLELRGGWTEPSVLWCVAVSESGSLKSPAFDRGIEPLAMLQDESMARHTRALAEFERDQKLYEREFALWRKPSSKCAMPIEPKRPVCQRYILADSTVEAVAPRLVDSPRGLLLAREELAGWIDGFDQYRNGRGGDVAHWLAMHGARSMTVDRKTGPMPTIHVPRAFVCVTGTIQPKTLQRVLGPDFVANGLAARLLIAHPPRRARSWTDAEVSPRTIERVHRVFRSLTDRELAFDANACPVPILFRLDAEAKGRFIAFVNEHGRQQLDLDGGEAAAWAKLEGYAARFALVFHLVQIADGAIEPDAPVSLPTLNAGIGLVNWFGREALRALAMCEEDAQAAKLRQLRDRIQAKGSSISVRDWQRSRSMSTADAAQRELDTLVQAGLATWGYCETSPTGGAPIRLLTLNPTHPTDRTPPPWPLAGDVSVSDPPRVSKTQEGAENSQALDTASVISRARTASDTDKTPDSSAPAGVVSVRDDEWGAA